MQLSLSESHTIPHIVISAPEDISTHPLAPLPETTQREVMQWAIHELIEQNRENESENKRQKLIIAGLGTATAALTLLVGITELIKSTGSD